jgi:hypothetical protein
MAPVPLVQGGPGSCHSRNDGSTDEQAETHGARHAES